jgi:hypothetical protein
MSALLEKLRRARQSTIVIGDHSFVIERPTPMAAMDWLQSDGDSISADGIKQFFEVHFSLKNDVWRRVAQYAIENFVVGWNLKEIDIIPGGTPIEAPFQSELFLVWVADYPAIVTKLAYEILNAYLTFVMQSGDDEKKPLPGLSPGNSNDSQTD